MYSSLHYSSMIDTDINKKFVAAFKKETGDMPSDNGPDGWVGMHAITDAIAAVHGDMSDPLKFVAALKAVHFDSPKGEISLDSLGQVVQSMYIREVEKTPEGPANVPIATYTHIDQYWPFTQ